MRESDYLIKELEVVYHPYKNNDIEQKVTIKTSKTAAELLFSMYNTNTMNFQEEFIVLYINAANNIIGVQHLSKGGITATSVDIRIVLATALKCFATGILISHNHPSGQLKPSINDEVITQNIKKACKYFDINLLDHIILAPSGEYFSFSDSSIL
jgi:DNA repair protein RadC